MYVLYINYFFCLQESSLDSLAQPLQFLDDFVRTKKSSSMADDAPKSATVLDVCSGQTDHINLKQVVSLRLGNSEQ